MGTATRCAPTATHRPLGAVRQPFAPAELGAHDHLAMVVHPVPLAYMLRDGETTPCYWPWLFPLWGC